jgi:hypothetical protein
MSFDGTASHEALNNIAATELHTETFLPFMFTFQVASLLVCKHNIGTTLEEVASNNKKLQSKRCSNVIFSSERCKYFVAKWRMLLCISVLDSRFTVHPTIE